MINTRGRPVSLLTLNDLHVFTLVMLAVVFVAMVVEVVVFGAPGHSGVSINMPKSYNAAAMRGSLRFDAMRITITRDGKVFFCSNYASPEMLPELVRKGVSEGAERKVYLQIDRDANYGVVSRVLAEVRTAGIGNVAFLVRKPTQVQAAAYAP